MTPTQLKLLLAGILLLGILGFGYYEGSKKYIALKAEIQQAAKDQQIKVDAINTHNTTVTKEEYAKVQTQLADANKHIDDLVSLPIPTIRQYKLPSTEASTKQSCSVANGPTTRGSEGTVTESVIATESLKADLQTALDAITAEQLWREWYKQ